MTTLIPIFLVNTLTRRSIENMNWLLVSGVFKKSPILVGSNLRRAPIPAHWNATIIEVPDNCLEIERCIIALQTANKMEEASYVALLSSDRNKKADPNFIRILADHLHAMPGNYAQYIGPDCTDYIFHKEYLIASINDKLPGLFTYASSHVNKHVGGNLSACSSYVPFFRKYDSIQKEIFSCMSDSHIFQYGTTLQEQYSPWRSSKAAMYR